VTVIISNVQASKLNQTYFIGDNDMDFCGSWESNGKVFSIQKDKNIYICSFPRKNIGIIFNNDLMVAEYDETAQSAGIGVYSPIGDGSSLYALWSSTGIRGQLGTGIALKCSESLGYDGEYKVQYFIGNREGSSFLVRIKRKKDNIYKLAWLSDNKEVLHGIGFLIENSLAFAWGSLDCRFDFNRLYFNVDDETVRLKRQTVTWDSGKISTTIIREY